VPLASRKTGAPAGPAPASARSPSTRPTRVRRPHVARGPAEVPRSAAWPPGPV